MQPGNVKPGTLTSQASKKIRDTKYRKANHDGKLSSVWYIMKTQPSWDAASYTVKKLVAVDRKTNMYYSDNENDR